MNQRIEAVALDAMGVMFTVGDDLRDLLIPYLRGKGCTLPDAEIVQLYRACYREGRPASVLWQGTGCDWREGLLEDEFIAEYELEPGVIEFLEAMREQAVPVFCLSNDVAEWSAKRRRHFGIDAFFAGCVVSGEQRVAKPSLLIFDVLAKMLPCPPSGCLFVDDRDYNVKGAQEAGFAGVVFNSTGTEDVAGVRGFAELQEFLMTESGPG